MVKIAKERSHEFSAINCGNLSLTMIRERYFTILSILEANWLRHKLLEEIDYFVRCYESEAAAYESL